MGAIRSAISRIPWLRQRAERGGEDGRSQEQEGEKFLGGKRHIKEKTMSL